MGEANLRGKKSEGHRRQIYANHLLIIEWLSEGEERTGTRLAESLKASNVPVKLVNCHSALEVLDALWRARDKLREDKLIPVIQIEAHGNDQYLEGPGPNSCTERLKWTELSEPLRNINITSRFNLIFIGATCEGIAAIQSLDVEQAAPYACVIGFGGKVNPSTLYRSLRELHRCLFISSIEKLGEAVANANRELNSSEGERLIITNCKQVGSILLHHFVEQENSSIARLINLQLKLAWQGKRLSLAEIERLSKKYMPTVLEDTQARWFAYELIPENRQRYRIDIKALLRGNV